MSKYTVELRRLIELYGRETVKSWFKKWSFSDYLRPDQIDTIMQAGIWDTDKLCEKILDEYYSREIGFETPDYFYRRVIVKMRSIMEREAPRIWTAAIKFDPLVNVDFTETYKSDYLRNENAEGSSNSTSQNQGTGLTVNSDTPQGQISKAQILEGRYASSTSANETDSTITDNSKSNTKGTNQGNENYTKNIKGNSGVSATAQKMIQQTRDIIITIMDDIVDDLSDLFMSIY